MKHEPSASSTARLTKFSLAISSSPRNCRAPALRERPLRRAARPRAAGRRRRAPRRRRAGGRPRPRRPRCLARPRPAESDARAAAAARGHRSDGGAPPPTGANAAVRHSATRISARRGTAASLALPAMDHTSGARFRAGPGNRPLLQWRWPGPRALAGRPGRVQTPSRPRKHARVGASQLNDKRRRAHGIQNEKQTARA